MWREHCTEGSGTCEHVCGQFEGFKAPSMPRMYTKFARGRTLTLECFGCTERCDVLLFGFPHSRWLNSCVRIAAKGNNSGQAVDWVAHSPSCSIIISVSDHASRLLPMFFFTHEVQKFRSSQDRLCINLLVLTTVTVVHKNCHGVTADHRGRRALRSSRRCHIRGSITQLHVRGEYSRRCQHEA